MRFRKTVGAEPLNLAKTALGKIRIIAAFDHPADHLVVELADITMLFESGHGAAQLVRLAAGKTGTDDGNLHRLFLKQRHPQCPLQNIAQRF